MLFILNREYKFFIPEKKTTVLQILLTVWNVTMSHKAVPVQFFGRSGKKKWHWVSGVIFGSVLRIFSLVFQFKLSLWSIFRGFWCKFTTFNTMQETGQCIPSLSFAEFFYL